MINGIGSARSVSNMLALQQQRLQVEPTRPSVSPIEPSDKSQNQESKATDLKENINSPKNNQSAETKTETRKDDAIKDNNEEQYTEAELDVIEQLKARDREVRTHEAAHAAVGGQHAGSPSYSFQRGPDGRSYAVGGEVSISVSPVAGDPEATIRKMDVVRRAALAPSQPSSQDRQVAQEAVSKKTVAQVELSKVAAEENAKNKEDNLEEKTNEASSSPTDNDPNNSNAETIAFANVEKLFDITPAKDSSISVTS